MMKKKNKGWLFRLLLPVMLLLLAMPVSASAQISMSSKKITAVVGQTCQLTLNGLTGEEQSIVWRVRRKAVADVSQDGLVTAKSAGTTRVIALVDGQRYRCNLTVTQSQPVTEIRLNKTVKSLVKGKRFRLKATVGPESAENKEVAWQSSDPGVAKVNAKGRVTATGIGTASITACAKDGSGVAASCTVTVTPESMSLNMTQLTLEVGKKANLKAPDGYTYVWASSDKTIAKVGKAGKVKGKKEGRAVVTALRVEDRQFASCYVTVVAAQSQTEEQPQQTGASAKALEFLALVQKYEQKLQSDKAAGVPWTYDGPCALTWAQVLTRSKEGKVGLSCVQPAQWGLRELGIIGMGDFKGVQGGSFRIVDRESFDQHCIIISGYKKASELIAEGTLIPGDICSYVGMRHTNIYAGDGKFYDSGRGGDCTLINGEYVFNSLGPIPYDSTIGSIVRIVK